jgi:hypothetical protein
MVFKPKSALKNFWSRKRSEKTKEKTSKKTKETTENEDYANICLGACMTVGQNVLEDCLLIGENVRGQCMLINERVREKRMVENAQENFMTMSSSVNRNCITMGDSVRERIIMFGKNATVYGTCMMIGENVHKGVEKIIGENGREVVDLTERSQDGTLVSTEIDRNDGQKVDTACIIKKQRTPLEQGEEGTIAASDLRGIIATDVSTISPAPSSVAKLSIDSPSVPAEAPHPVTSKRDLTSLVGSDSSTVSSARSVNNLSRLITTDAPTVSPAPSTTSRRDSTSLAGSASARSDANRSRLITTDAPTVSPAPSTTSRRDSTSLAGSASARSDANRSRLITTDAPTVSPVASVASMRKVESTSATSVSPSLSATGKSDVEDKVTDDIRPPTPNNNGVLVGEVLLPNETKFGHVDHEKKAVSIDEKADTREDVEFTREVVSASKEVDEDLDIFHWTCMNIGGRMHKFFDGALCKGKGETSGAANQDNKKKLDQEKKDDSGIYHSTFMMIGEQVHGILS